MRQIGPWIAIAVILAETACVSKGDTNVTSGSGGSGTAGQAGTVSGGTSSGGVGGSSGGGAAAGGSGGGASCPDSGDLCTSEGVECGDDSCGNRCGDCDADAGQECGGLGQCIKSPALVGCADGTREGFANESAFPTIAACKGTWSAQSMRATRTGQPCGNDVGPCTVPEDACAAGWHVCMRNGWPKDLTDRVSSADCKSPVAGTGYFYAGSSVTSDSNGVCNTPLDCKTGANSYLAAVCCGSLCQIQADIDCVWLDATPFRTDFFCGNLASQDDGVLCCKDPPVTGT
jgi:hypothetical protein